MEEKEEKTKSEWSIIEKGNHFNGKEYDVIYYTCNRWKKQSEK